MTKFNPFRMTQKGASVVEAAVILGLITVVPIAAVKLTGVEVEETYCKVVQAISGDHTKACAEPEAPRPPINDNLEPVDPPEEAPPYEDPDFTFTTAFQHILYPDSTVGVQYHLEKLEGTNGYDGNLLFRKETNFDLFSLCWQLTSASSLACADPARNEYELPKDVFKVGYSINNLPVDVREEYGQLISFGLQPVADPSATFSFGDVAQTRESDNSRYDLTSDFKDITFEAGRTGPVQVMLPFTHTGGQKVFVFKKDDPNANFDLCVSDHTKLMSPVVCKPYDSEILITDRTEKVGYRLRNLPADTSAEYEQRLQFNISPIAYFSTNGNVNIKASRTPARPDFKFILNTKFDAITYPIGLTSQQTHIKKLEYSGSAFNELEFSKPENVAGIALCYQQEEGAGPVVCAEEDVHSITLNGSEFGIGFRVLDIPLNTARKYAKAVNFTMIAIGADPADRSAAGLPIRVSREQPATYFSVTSSFRNILLPLGAQDGHPDALVMNEFNLESSYGDATVSYAKADTTIYSLCYQLTVTSDVICLAPNANTVAIPVTTYAVGYKDSGIYVDTGRAYSKELNLIFRRPSAPSVTSLHKVTSTRPLEEPFRNIEWDITSKSRSYPQSTPPEQIVAENLMMAPISISTNLTTTVDVIAQEATTPYELCAKLKNNEQPNCYRVSTSNDYRLTITIADIEELGIRELQAPSADDTVAYNITRNLSVSIAGHSFPYTVTTVRERVLITATIVADSVDIVLPAGTTDEQLSEMFPNRRITVPISFETNSNQHIYHYVSSDDAFCYTATGRSNTCPSVRYGSASDNFNADRKSVV